jgi:serine/threonine protein phosphatase PrpC
VPVSFAAQSAQHIGDRQEQQDRVAIIKHPSQPGTFMLVVADGMGGHAGGAMAAEQVVATARQVFSAYSPKSDSAEEVLRNIVNEAHTVIKLTSFTSEADPHSTFVGLIMHADRACWAHCGDSRLYHFRAGQLARRSVDHSYIEYLIKQ